MAERLDDRVVQRAVSLGQVRAQVRGPFELGGGCFAEPAVARCAPPNVPEDRYVLVEVFQKRTQLTDDVRHGERVGDPTLVSLRRLTDSSRNRGFETYKSS